MTWNWKENNKQKHQFRSYYCAGCKQKKPCQLLTGWDSEWKSYCCSCYFQSEQEKFQEYNSYEKVLVDKQREKQETLKELKQFRSWKEQKKCSYCGKKAIQQDWLLRSELVCSKCAKGHAESCFTYWQKWYWKWWKINLEGWLEKFQGLPVNAECAREWMIDNEHLRDCGCLEKEAKELYDLFANSLKKCQEKLKECQCIKSEKVRVDSDYYAWCERCGGSIAVASKKRVIKNRNDPRFWGLNISKRVLCLNCLGKLAEKMPVSKKYTLNKYLKRGY